MLSLEQRVALLEERNQRVDNAKSWETSWLRRGSIMLITYGVAFTFMRLTGLEPALIGACVPVGGYVLSTLSLPWLKKYSGQSRG